ncbi:MAG: hypothetical protein JO126_04075 [Alphaproteobacteria bacterium]|nr:hypothetical protein [Alphaproteobacteria bacterium]MBV8548616.1 hypothetical protein [Alphaproteobacteria bacterium]
MKTYGLVSLLLFPLLLTGCGENASLAAIEGVAAVGAWATSPWTPAAADTQSQIPEHENWCYTTMGDPECYSEPQDQQPETLINVDPQSRYPLNNRSYQEAVMHAR